MQRYLTNAQMRAADSYTINTLGVPSQTLMERAGCAIAEVVLSICNGGKSVQVVCGTGNNGGDGYVCARKLMEAGVNVTVFAIDGKLSSDCARERANYNGGYSDRIGGDIIVDCIFGTGLSREVTGDYKRIIEEINASGATVVSADIPSGLNGDNGLVMGAAVKADVTVAIAEQKIGFVLGDGMDYCGTVIKKDIGISLNENSFAHVYEQTDIAKFFPARRRNSHKGTFGTATLMCGSLRYVGAAVLATRAALQSGCGYVRLDCPAYVKKVVAPVLPQTVFGQDSSLSSKAIAVGMGCGINKTLYNKICYLLKNFTGTLIIDADGLNTIAKYGIDCLKNKNCEVILTPHAKEFSRLSGLTVTQILSDPLQTAQKFSDEYNVTLVLKGAASVICGGGNTAINTTGSTALAKAGSGDMLSGYMCGCAARSLAPFDAAVCAHNILGIAAQLSSEEKTDYCATADDILENLPKAVKCVTQS